MAYSTTWEKIYEQTNKEAIDAQATNDALTEPTLWPISGTTGKELPPEKAWWKLTPEE